MEKLRSIEFYKEYFIKFYLALDKGVQKKYDYAFVIIRQAQRIPSKFFKKITDRKNLFEVRVEYENNIYRTFCCFDGDNVIVLFNSFQKKTQKTQKTPAKEIEKAVKLMKQYFGENEN